MTYYYAHDHLYSVAAVFGPNGGLLQGERYEYDAYGTVTVMNRLYNPQASSTIGNPYTFTGRRLDSLDPDGSGGHQLKLMYYRARTYDPQTGRFMQRDPLGIDPAGGIQNPFIPINQYKDGMNSYLYVSSNPVQNSDPYGLCIPVGEDEEGNLIIKSCGDNEFIEGSCFIWIHESKTKVPVACPGEENEEEKEFNPPDGWPIVPYDAWETRPAECTAIDGYFRHCVSSCRLSRSFRGVYPIPNPATDLYAYMIGLWWGDDWPWHESQALDSPSDREAYRHGIYNSYKLFTSCRASCAKSLTKQCKRRCPCDTPCDQTDAVTSR